MEEVLPFHVYPQEHFVPAIKVSLRFLVPIVVFNFPVIEKVSKSMPTLYNSKHTSPDTTAVVVAIAGMIFPAINLL